MTLVWRSAAILCLVLANFSHAETVLDATPYLDPKLPTYGIQDAVDALPPEGGVVQLPEGRFEIECFIELRDGVTLRGKGSKTIVAAGRNEDRATVARDAEGSSRSLVLDDASKFYPGQTIVVWQQPDWQANAHPFVVKSVDTQARSIILSGSVGFPLKAGRSQVGGGLYALLAAPLKAGDSSLTVTDTRPFRPGESIVLVGNSNSGPNGYGWGIEQNVITDIDPEKKILLLKNPTWISAFPRTLVTHGYGGILARGSRPFGKPMAGVGIQDLVVEGWKGDAKPRVPHFSLGAVTLVDCDNFRIRNVVARDWHSDGISLQSCRDGVIENCEAAQNRGDGLHSGTGSQRIRWENCRSTRNRGVPQLGTLGDGHFFCWDNLQIRIAKCVFSENEGAGIGRLGSGGNLGDRENTVEECLVERNGRAGIELDGNKAGKNRILRNTVRDNSRAAPGKYPGILLEGTGECVIEGNLVESTEKSGAQRVGIEERGESVSNRIVNNRVSGHSDGDLRLRPEHAAGRSPAK
jgi:parallel beta-helix repeat protein